MALSTLLSYSLGIFIEPLQKEFGWSRADVTSGQIISAAMAIVFGPVVGSMIDRVGPRRIGICACFAMCLATALLSMAGPSLDLWRGLWVVVAVAVVMIQPTVWTSAITHLFTAGRGLALAVTLCGSGIASLITPPLTYMLIEYYGWRTAFILLPLIWGCLVIPIVGILFRTPRDRLPAARDRSLSTGQTAGQVIRSEVLTIRFACLAAAGLAFAAVVVTLAVSVVPLLSDYGLTRGEAAALASLIGIAAIAGRLAIGLLLDRVTARYIAALCACLPMVGASLLLAGSGSAPMAVAAVLVFGLSLGAELDILAYLTSRYFSQAHFGFLFGIMGGLLTLAGGAGPVVINAVYDATGSYRLALMAAVPICLTAALLFLSLGPIPQRAAIGDRAS